MNRRQIGLKLALTAAGRALEVDTFDKRLTLQKLTYLLEQGGVHLGYSFSWYLRGPYSPSLTEDAFNLVAEEKLGQTDTSKWVFDHSSSERVRLLDKLWSNISADKLSRHLELLSSVHYILHNHWLPIDATPEEISQKLAEHKKDFSADEVESAIVRLKETGLLAT